MIQETKLTIEEIRDLYEKGASLDPHKFELDHISSSGIHIAEITEE